MKRLACCLGTPSITHFSNSVKMLVIMKSMTIVISLVEFDICSLEVEYVS